MYMLYTHTHTHIHLYLSPLANISTVTLYVLLCKLPLHIHVCGELENFLHHTLGSTSFLKGGPVFHVLAP